MTTFNFSLKFKLPSLDMGEDELLDRLAEAGCTDAIIGLGTPGKLALEFDRASTSAGKAMLSGIEDVKRAIPGAQLIEATPDLVSVTEVASMVGVSRQNIRQLMLKNLESFPAAVHEGSTNIWHLTHLLSWFEEKGLYEDAVKQYMAISACAQQVNLIRESKLITFYESKDVGVRPLDIEKLLAS